MRTRLVGFTRPWWTKPDRRDDASCLPGFRLFQPSRPASGFWVSTFGSPAGYSHPAQPSRAAHRAYRVARELLESHGFGSDSRVPSSRSPGERAVVRALGAEGSAADYTSFAFFRSLNICLLARGRSGARGAWTHQRRSDTFRFDGLRAATLEEEDA